MIDEENSPPKLFKEVYGPAILTDPAVSEHLQKVTLQSVAIGEEIPGDHLPSDEKIVLLSGRIRALCRSGLSGTERTALTLEKGDIWDSSFTEKHSLLMIVSSDEAIICKLPSALVMKNPILSRHWESVLNSGALSMSERSSSRQESSPASTELSLPPSVSHAAKESNPLPASCFLNQVLAHYKFPLSEISEDGEGHDLQSLAQKLEFLGFKLQEASYTWAQLLNARYPFVLECDNRLCWIQGRKGNALLEDGNGKSIRFVPDRIDSQTRYNLLFLQPPAVQHENQSHIPCSPGWYLNLCLRTWFLSGQMVLSSIFIQLFSLGMPIFYIIIFDRVFGRQNLSTLDVMAIGIILVMLFDISVKLLRSYVLSHQLESIDKASMRIFLERIFNLSLAKSSPQTIRSYAERFSDLVRINQTLISTLLITSLDVAFSVILVIFLCFLHFQLALISLASLVPIAILSFWTTPLAKKRALGFNQTQRQCQVKLAEILENKETVQSLNAESNLKRKILQKIEEHLHGGFGARFDRISGPVGQGFIANAGTIVTLYFGAHEVLQGEISYGIYIAINMLSRQVIGSVQKLFAAILQLYEALGTIEQLKPLLSAENNDTGDDRALMHGVRIKAVSGHISMVDVCFRYQPDSPWVLRDFSLNIEPGEKIVVTGKSGSGKTTMIRLLQRLYEPGSGYICLDGFNLADMDIGNLRHHMGVALQKPGIFTGTIRENIALGNPSAPMKEIVEAATMAQLDQFLLKLPQGFDTPVAPMGTNLSGGQAACIALARILLMKPSILILDEALAPCDPLLHDAVFARIFEKYRDATSIFVTDYLPVHQRADRIVVIHEGQVVEQGTYRELIQQKGYYYLLHHTEQWVEI